MRIRAGMANNREAVCFFLPVRAFRFFLAECYDLIVELSTKMRTCVLDRSGKEVVSIVHGPVSQADLPASS